MLPLLRRSTMFWCVWTLLGTVALFANPWLPFSWAELVACLGALVLALDRRTRRETLLAAGLPAIALLVVAEGGPLVVPRLVTSWTMFIGSVLLASRAIEDQQALEAHVGHLLRVTDPQQAWREFERAAEREIARARRHERSFGVLSIAPHPRSLKAASPDADPILRRLEEARQVQDIASVLSRELHRYATVAATEHRALCLVPELDDAAVDALIGRLGKAVDVQLAIEVEAGSALFPDDALSLEDLVAAADQRRRTARLASVDAPPASERNEEPPRRADRRNG